MGKFDLTAARLIMMTATGDEKRRWRGKEGEGEGDGEGGVGNRRFGFLRVNERGVGRHDGWFYPMAKTMGANWISPRERGCLVLLLLLMLVLVLLMMIMAVDGDGMETGRGKKGGE
ncbi:hypothetical protein CBR_g22337 [Chara braunii]|uniref:Uncharacterized protein n=1 Tax=Chara braunii TaxID=69332 RepID=A0A388JUT7_CHABU|nr:hypothetical protein CBR_g22337 [Chara braunii]|eukprot:GBG61540.1 hypothetical protein CBR_g22337 [Chara braunii]